MKRVEVQTTAAPPPGGAYSQGIFVNGVLYTAGVGPHDPVSYELVGTTVGDQTRQVMRNLRAILAMRGLDFSNVVKTTAHLENIHRDFAEYDDVYRSFLSPPFPVRTTVGSTLSGFLVEIDVIAHA